jgi:hypothetical protein
MSLKYAKITIYCLKSNFINFVTSYQKKKNVTCVIINFFTLKNDNYDFSIHIILRR